jgi:hypothetical protein
MMMMMNRKDLEESGRDLNCGTTLELNWRDSEKPQKPSIRIAGDPTEIRIENLPNTSLKR